jgi:rhodanese-related sulfurtransferase
MQSTISAESLYATLGLPDAAAIVDLRSDADCAAQPRIIPGAVRRDARQIRDWLDTLPDTSLPIVYATRSDGVGATVTDELRSFGYSARQLEGDLEAWMAAGYATVRIRRDIKAPGGSRWITRERPKIDRLACPWLIRRFIDPEAQFFYTPSHRVRSDSKALDAEPYDIAEVTFSHRGPRCSFDAFLDEFDLDDPVLREVADVVRAADTGALEQCREAPGLLAISLGLAANITDDILLLEQAMPLYDALYSWRKRASRGTHGWPQPNT